MLHEKVLTFVIIVTNIRNSKPRFKIWKKQEKAKSDFDVFRAARQRAMHSFFSVMRPWLRKQNYIKYVDRSALDKDLLILKKSISQQNSIPAGNCQILLTVHSFTSVNAGLYRIIIALHYVKMLSSQFA